eukprot:4346051-Prymnesium_polylepis.1
MAAHRVVRLAGAVPDRARECQRARRRRVPAAACLLHSVHVAAADRVLRVRAGARNVQGCARGLPARRGRRPLTKLCDHPRAGAPEHLVRAE